MASIDAAMWWHGHRAQWVIQMGDRGQLAWPQSTVGHLDGRLRAGGMVIEHRGSSRWETEGRWHGHRAQGIIQMGDRGQVAWPQSTGDHLEGRPRAGGMAIEHRGSSRWETEGSWHGHRAQGIMQMGDRGQLAHTVCKLCVGSWHINSAITVYSAKSRFAAAHYRYRCARRDIFVLQKAKCSR